MNNLTLRCHILSVAKTLEDFDPTLFAEVFKLYDTTTPVVIIGAACSGHTSLATFKATSFAVPSDILSLSALKASGIVVVAAVVLIFPRDVCHHSLKTSRVAFFVILVNEVGVNHFVDQGAFNLFKIKVFIPKKLNGQIDLIRLKVLASASGGVSQCFGKATSLVSTISGSSCHAAIPHNWNIRDLSVKVFVIQPMEHFFNVRLHFTLPVL